MHALLELDCIPAGMEIFPAANETQWSLIKKVIDDCDYYLLILGGRYGSLSPEGISYTEMEYRYALEVRKPIIAFLHKEPGKISSEKSEQTDAGREKLSEFRGLVEKRLCKMWATPQELGSVVSRSLVQLIKSTPAVGWVRANELADREATLELLTLRRRVEELQRELSSVRTSAPEGSEGLAKGDESFQIGFTFRARELGSYTTAKGWHGNFSATWDEIFSTIAPLLIHEAQEKAIVAALDELIEVENYQRLAELPKLKGRNLSSFSINQDDFQTIKVQLRALGLITKSEKSRSIKDSGSYWTLTSYGDEVMTRLRAIRSHSTSAPADEAPQEEEEEDA